MRNTNNDGRIRTMIVEDHFVVRVGLSAIINSQPDMVIVAETGNGRQAVELFAQHDLFVSPVESVVAAGQADLALVGNPVQDLEEHVPAAALPKQKGVGDEGGGHVRHAFGREHGLGLARR